MDGAGGLALAFEVSPLVVGLTVVAFGTSAPELFVSLLAALRGQPGISLGNVLGSNVINLALVLGLSVLIRPVATGATIARVDLPVMLLSYVLVVGAAITPTVSVGWWLQGNIGPVEGAIMLGVLAVYLRALYRRPGAARSELLDHETDPDTARARPVWKDLVLVLVGIIALALGAEGLVRGASWLAVELFGASERFVGIAIVALGTSLPELVTTIVSLVRGETDISVGNLVGSNIFNGLMVAGTTSLVRPLEIGLTDYRLDVGVMIAVSLLVTGAALLHGRLSRLLGATLLTAYLGYLIYLGQTMTA